MQKPRVQVLLRGFPIAHPEGEARVGILDPTTGQPKMALSHQVFQALVHSSMLETIDFMLHEYHVQPFEPLHYVTVTGSTAHKLSTAKVTAAKVQTRLPFGLKSPRRKRQRKAGPPKKGQDKPSASSGRVPKDLEEIQEELQGLGGACDPVKSESSSSSSSDEEVELAEQPFLVPEAMEAERRIEHILTKRAELMEARGEAVLKKGLVVSVSESEAQIDPTAAAAAPSWQGKSFCNAAVGLVDCGVQTSKRLAKCRECQTPVALGGIRFAYAFSRTKIHAWVHSKCLIQHLERQNASLSQALTFLEGQQSKHDLQPNVQQEIATLEGELRRRLADAEKLRWRGSAIT